MRIKINARLKPRPLFEIRYVKANFRGSNVIFGIAGNLYGVYLCIYPFVFSITVSRKIKPSALTPEELAEIEQEEKETVV